VSMGILYLQMALTSPDQPFAGDACAIRWRHRDASPSTTGSWHAKARSRSARPRSQLARQGGRGVDPRQPRGPPRTQPRCAGHHASQALCRNRGIHSARGAV
jgi:hypothetical protein